EFAPVVSANGKRILARGGGGALIWTTDGRRVAPLRPNGDRNFGVAALSGNAVIAAASGAPNTEEMTAGAPTVVWRVGHPRPLLSRLPSGSPVLLDGDGGIVAVGARAWRTGTGQPVRALNGVVALSPNGRVAVVARGGHILVLHV